ncbi:hypothetical protein HDU83_006151 [Entophlyctis luteolus]|nr:hypothetical protein HDU83_006151 [Entophlyctis luteolus]
MRHTAPASFLPLRQFSQYYNQFVCVFLFGASLLSTSAAAAAAATTNTQSCVTSYDSTVDYFPEKISSANLTHLVYTYNKSYKTINNTFSGEFFVLYQCGTPKPNITGATLVLPVPIHNVTVGDTTVVPYLELLGLRRNIKYTADSTLSYISSPCVQALVAADPTAIVEVDAANSTRAITEISSTDIYLNYFGSWVTNVSNSVTFPASADPGIKGRAEWLGFLGSFFNLEGLANNVTSQLFANFNALSTAANAVSSKPVIAWIEYDAAYSAAYPEAWIIDARQYEIDYTTAAGATIYQPSSVGSATLIGASSQATQYSYSSAAAFLAALGSVDIVIDLTFGDSVFTDFEKSFNLSSSAASSYKFLANQQIYMFNREVSPTNGGSEFFEAAVIEENVMLADLISVTHPSVLKSSYQPSFLRNIYSSSNVVVLTASNCTDYNAALTLPTIALNSGAVPLTSTVALAVGLAVFMMM